jgi:hypothetical protein
MLFPSLKDPATILSLREYLLSLDLNGGVTVENDHFLAPTSSSVECLLLYSLPSHQYDRATNHETFSFQQNGDSPLFDYVKLPRIAEYLIANSIQPRGRDLFRFTNVLDNLYWLPIPIYKAPTAATGTRRMPTL